MKDILLSIVLNLFAFICAVGAVYMAMKGIDGWGWFLVAGVISTSYTSE